MAATKPTLVAQPIAQPTDDGAIAPWPAIDKYPIVIGPGLSLSYISSIFRLSLVGYRQQYVDLLDEMLEKDPHAFSVIQKRVLSVAGGRLEITPAKVQPGTNDEKLAKELADFCADMLACIPSLEQHLATLAWATYYAIVGLETHWTRDGSGWFADRLSFVHSRRLSYPVAGSWDLYVWDQGQVLPYDAYGASPTNRAVFGFRVADAPGKFIIHAPQIRGAYPTREGLGRQIAYWLALKLVATRGAPQYLERFARPWPEATFTTGDEGKPGRPASQEDVDTAKEALNAMGAGSLSSWVHADTVKLDLRTPDNGSAAKLTYPEWISICDGQISKAALGSTLGTEVGPAGGNRALGETQRKSEVILLRYDAKLLGATLKRDLLTWMVRLNYPSVPARLIPDVTIHVEDPPDPLAVIERAKKGAEAGIPVDADRVADDAGLPVVKAGDTKARRMFPIMASKNPEAFDADLAARAAELAPAQTEDDETGEADDEEPQDTQPPDDQPGKDG